MSSDRQIHPRFLPLTAEGAWSTYLEATRHVEGDRYIQVEQAAWDELQATLTELAKTAVGHA